MSNRNRIDPVEGSARSLFFGARVARLDAGRPHPTREPGAKVKDKLKEMAERINAIKQPIGNTAISSSVDPSAILVPSAEWQGVDWSEIPEEELQAQLQSPPKRVKLKE